MYIIIVYKSKLVNCNSVVLGILYLSILQLKAFKRYQRKFYHYSDLWCNCGS